MVLLQRDVSLQEQSLNTLYQFLSGYLIYFQKVPEYQHED